MQDSKADIKFIKRFFVGIALFMVVIAAIIIIFDPFYHYHKNLGFLAKVLEERDYEVTGTLDHFDYSNVILGTSVAENYNTNQFKELFGGETVKAIRAGGSNADLIWYYERAAKTHKVENAFWFFDITAARESLTPTFKSSNTDYLTNKNPFDDIEYIWNKDVLMKKIPLQLVYTYVLPYDEGEAYSWYKTKTFSKDQIMMRYYPLDEFLPMADAVATEEFRENLQAFAECIEAHPETNFVISFSPVSILWWDNEYREGNLAVDLAEQALLVTELSKYGNVKIYSFEECQEIILNLDNYMDSLHFSEQINRQIVQMLANGEHELKVEDLEDWKSNIYSLVEKFSTEGVLEYYPEAVVK